LDLLRWGLVPHWAKDIKVGFANINAKAEGIENKPAFRDAFERRRCLLPVDNFYEGKKTATGKQPYAIALADRGLMALAGLCRTGARRPVSGCVPSRSSPRRRTSCAPSSITECQRSSGLRFGRGGWERTLADLPRLKSLHVSYCRSASKRDPGEIARTNLMLPRKLAQGRVLIGADRDPFTPPILGNPNAFPYIRGGVPIGC
jgi:hypothetical protein